jgi:hypothetical protein
VMGSTAGAGTYGRAGAFRRSRFFIIARRPALHPKRSRARGTGYRSRVLNVAR